MLGSCRLSALCVEALPVEEKEVNVVFSLKVPVVFSSSSDVLVPSSDVTKENDFPSPWSPFSEGGISSNFLPGLSFGWKNL
ncbi:hypothetical protein JZ751_003081 [Albula glossodonta]|uniref:Uncharacterized protein n=1 Tax=Albula glossodonta TaxID=121402 RepID=A0A8T2N8L4_9TELE|nr:hypothetical protein JZ751_003081 [Albula glossodonta]